MLRSTVGREGVLKCAVVCNKLNLSALIKTLQNLFFLLFRFRVPNSLNCVRLSARAVREWILSFHLQFNINSSEIDLRIYSWQFFINNIHTHLHRLLAITTLRLALQYSFISHSKDWFWPEEFTCVHVLYLYMSDGIYSFTYIWR